MSRTLPARASTLPACAYATLLVALTLGLIGLIADNSGLMRGANLLAIAAAPFLVVGHIRHAHRVSDDQLADAHRDGYMLALDHVARGLLDPEPTAPHGGHRASPTTDEARNIRHLHLIHPIEKRQAG
ncbi:hypothetical protein ACPCJU_16800 [Streptomyces thermodiastaticus]